VVKVSYRLNAAKVLRGSLQTLLVGLQCGGVLGLLSHADVETQGSTR
jgi:hypothetical protein